jgi:hypothetical protein
MTTPDGGIIDRKRPGRRRTHFPARERRQTLLTITFGEISEAQPTELRDIIDRAEALRIKARMSDDKTLEAVAAVIKQRAQTRLASWKRREAKA